MRWNQNIMVVFTIITISCRSTQSEKKAANADLSDSLTTPALDSVSLPAPYATKSTAGFSNVTGWPSGKQLLAPVGFTVRRFADSLHNPRWIYVSKSGDVFVVESNTETGPP